MPIVFAFCRTAASVRFKALATSAAGVFDFECAFRARTSSFVQGTRPVIFVLAINSTPFFFDRSLYGCASRCAATRLANLSFCSCTLTNLTPMRWRLASPFQIDLTYSCGRGTGWRLSFPIDMDAFNSSFERHDKRGRRHPAKHGVVAAAREGQASRFACRLQVSSRHLSDGDSTRARSHAAARVGAIAVLARGRARDLSPSADRACSWRRFEPCMALFVASR
jgi:hypothetical protein